MAETLSDVMKSINKKFGENIMKVGVDDLTEYGTLSIGSPGFDFCLYNSFNFITSIISLLMKSFKTCPGPTLGS